MVYNVKYSGEIDDGILYVKQSSVYIPDNQILRLQLSVDGVENIKLRYGNKDFYMIKSCGKYELKLSKGIFDNLSPTFKFVAEIPGYGYVKEIESGEFTLNLNIKNIDTTEYNYITELQNKLNAIISKTL